MASADFAGINGSSPPSDLPSVAREHSEGYMEEDACEGGARKPSNGGGRPKVVVIMGPTGSGKSRLAIDLASHFPIEIINADSMQVYQGLDVLTNKVPPNGQKGIPHHLLGNVSPNVEFTAKQFRDSAIPIINDILSRDCLPVLVGGTNYYIQALVSPFLLDDSAKDICEAYLSDPDEEQDSVLGPGRDCFKYDYNNLKEIDPVAANRIHPNDHRKINQYLSLYTRSHVLPSKIFQGKAAENWGRAGCFRYDCCFICVDASLFVLDQYVNQRVDSMVSAGLLDEVYDIYNPNAEYTRGLRQAIGVREFVDFLRLFIFGSEFNGESELTDGFKLSISTTECDKVLKEKMGVIMNSSANDHPSLVLREAIAKVKLNTRRLVRRQKRRLNRLQSSFGWKIHYVDSTEYLSSKLEDSWAAQVTEPAVKIIRSFIFEDSSSMNDMGKPQDCLRETVQRDLWTQYTCEACRGRVLRGAHEWEQHRRGRGHQKRILSLRKSGGLSLVEQEQQ